MERGLPAQEICDLTKIDPWFIHQIEELTAMNRRAAAVTVETASKELLREVKRNGTSDEQLAQIWRTTPASVRLQRARYGVAPVFKRVDTCAAEFESFSRIFIPLMRTKTNPIRNRASRLDSRSARTASCVGIEFDYCCRFLRARRRFETIMVNCIRKRSPRITTRPTVCISSRSL
jgi:carbamoyl-phosphate synthase large subunit